MNQTVIDLEVEIEHEGERLDKYLALSYPDQSRSYFQKIIKDGNVTIDGKALKASYRMSEGDIVTVVQPEAKSIEILAEDIPLDILYEDKYIIAVNKPAGLATQTKRLGEKDLYS